MKEILLPLNGSTIKCKIGFGVTIAAADHIRELRKTNYRKDREMVAELGDTVEIKAMIADLLRGYLETQIPSENEVKEWLQTLPGMRFAIKYGTQQYPMKLTDETVELVMNEIGQEEFTEIVKTISEICDGEVAAGIKRSTAEQMIEIAQLELERLVRQKDEFAKKIREEVPAADANATKAGSEAIDVAK